MEDGYGFDALIEAFEIFKKYDNPKWPLNCQHDELFVAVSPLKVNKEDKQRLEELGFNEDKGLDGFKSFRFGSC